MWGWIKEKHISEELDEIASVILEIGEGKVK